MEYKYKYYYSNHKRAGAPLLAISYLGSDLDGSTLDLGNVNTASGRVFTFNIRNDGNATLNITNLYIWNTSNLQGNTLSSSSELIAAGDSVNVTLTLDPTVVGALSCNFSLLSNGGNLTIPLTGTGIEQDVDITINSSAASNGGTTAITGLTENSIYTKTIRISNTGSDSLTVNSFSIISTTNAGTPTTDYPGGDQAISSGSYLDVIITFTPPSYGTTSVGFEIISNDPDSESDWIHTISGTADGATSSWTLLDLAALGKSAPYTPDLNPSSIWTSTTEDSNGISLTFDGVTSGAMNSMSNMVGYVQTTSNLFGYAAPLAMQGHVVLASPSPQAGTYVGPGIAPSTYTSGCMGSIVAGTATTNGAGVTSLTTATVNYDADTTLPARASTMAIRLPNNTGMVGHASVSIARNSSNQAYAASIINFSETNATYGNVVLMFGRSATQANSSDIFTNKAKTWVRAKNGIMYSPQANSTGWTALTNPGSPDAGSVNSSTGTTTWAIDMTTGGTVPTGLFDASVARWDLSSQFASAGLDLTGKYITMFMIKVVSNTGSGTPNIHAGWRYGSKGFSAGVRYQASTTIFGISTWSSTGVSNVSGTSSSIKGALGVFVPAIGTSGTNYLGSAGVVPYQSTGAIFSSVTFGTNTSDGATVLDGDLVPFVAVYHTGTTSFNVWARQIPLDLTSVPS